MGAGCFYWTYGIFTIFPTRQKYVFFWFWRKTFFASLFGGYPLIFPGHFSVMAELTLKWAGNMRGYPSKSDAKIYFSSKSGKNIFLARWKYSKDAVCSIKTSSTHQSFLFFQNKTSQFFPQGFTRFHRNPFQGAIWRMRVWQEAKHFDIFDFSPTLTEPEKYFSSTDFKNFKSFEKLWS